MMPDKELTARIFENQCDSHVNLKHSLTKRFPQSGTPPNHPLRTATSPQSQSGLRSLI